MKYAPLVLSFSIASFLSCPAVRAAEDNTPAAAGSSQPAKPETDDSAAGLWKQINRVHFLHPVDGEEAARQAGLTTEEKYHKAQSLCHTLIERYPESEERWNAELELIQLKELASHGKLDTYPEEQLAHDYETLYQRKEAPASVKARTIFLKLLTLDLRSTLSDEKPKKILAELNDAANLCDARQMSVLLSAAEAADVKSGTHMIAAISATDDNSKLKEAFHSWQEKAEIQQLQQLAKTDPAKAKERLQELAKNPRLSAAAAKALETVEKRLEAISKPLELAFTAVDGRKVDLAELRGKVVLVDFWATWCGPCMAEVPHVVEAYNKYHDQGFEVVGISLDQEDAVDKLQSVVKAKGMVWPQCLDKKAGKQGFAEQFGISSIPTMWLINKQGLLVDLNARGALAEKVEKLLIEHQD